MNIIIYDVFRLSGGLSRGRYLYVPRDGKRHMIAGTRMPYIIRVILKVKP